MESVCIVSIYRVPRVASLSLTDAPWSDVDACVWSVVEVCVGIVGACLPTYRPLFLRLCRNGARTVSTRDISWPTSHDQPGEVMRGDKMTKLGVGVDVYEVLSDDDRKTLEAAWETKMSA